MKDRLDCFDKGDPGIDKVEFLVKPGEEVISDSPLARIYFNDNYSVSVFRGDSIVFTASIENWNSGIGMVVETFCRISSRADDNEAYVIVEPSPGL